VDADVGRDAGEDQVADPARAQQQIQVGRVERALAGLVDDQLAVDRRDLGHDLPTRLAADEDPAARSFVADAGADPL